jgi:putative transposase
LADIPQHVVQRGNDGEACFVDERDYLDYLGRLCAASSKHRVAVHAYVLMSNHVHLLATQRSAEGVARMMQAVGSAYVPTFNARHGRTGTLWDGRYFASLVGSDAYLWNCHRYIELNPVRAGIVSDPSEYRWSSFGRNALGRADPLVQPHPAYDALSVDPPAAYRGFFLHEMLPATVEAIRDRLRNQRAFGDERFLFHVDTVASRSSMNRARGRPRRAEK